MRWRAGQAGPIRAGWEHLVLAGVLTLVTAAPSAAQGYSTTLFVPSKQNECVGVPDCLSDVEPAVSVPARGRAPARFACPQSHPHLWAWDVGQHEHISVKLTAVDRSSATIEGTNLAEVEGHFIVHLGCSTAPYAGSAFLKSRHLAPTGWLGSRSRRPDATRDPQ